MTRRAGGWELCEARKEGGERRERARVSASFGRFVRSFFRSAVSSATAARCRHGRDVLLKRKRGTVIEGGGEQDAEDLVRRCRWRAMTEPGAADKHGSCSQPASQPASRQPDSTTVASRYLSTTTNLFLLLLHHHDTIAIMARATWRSDLLAAFAERDAREKAQAGIISEYTRLADRAASHSSSTSSSAPPPQPSDTTDASSATSSSATSSTPIKSPPPATPPADLQALHFALTTLRTDLATSQRDRTTLQTQLTTATTALTTIQRSSAANLRELDKVKNERYTLEQKLRQRDDESKLNRKMIENLQDEIIALNIQLNIGEQAKARLKGENEELIARWMALKKDEADAMNNNSRFS
ncbi:LOW QUALITY PROTEIN: hypothetical protein Dda_2656 [Drechslerella dactyloides]|uniref:Autophagy-related protein 16 domain-containing protein n=1 Tax=Drechslerella dactyloides TaxID=74499 RepID=A0AAD6J0U5_DREDA|nr:LOW QUALITY PROTEIN: hypothetical protein Dda_2656 [Drechslerella dactyloides]